MANFIGILRGLVVTSFLIACANGPLRDTRFVGTWECNSEFNYVEDIIFAMTTKTTTQVDGSFEAQAGLEYYFSNGVHVVYNFLIRGDSTSSGDLLTNIDRSIELVDFEAPEIITKEVVEREIMPIVEKIGEEIVSKYEFLDDNTLILKDIDGSNEQTCCRANYCS